MTRAASLAAVLSAAFMVAISGAASALVLSRGASPVAAVVPAASSDAHKGIGGRYGGYKSLGPKSLGRKSLGPRNFSKSVGPGNIGPGGTFGAAGSKSDATKQPYPYRYYYDTSRGNYGCHRLGRRAIETDNANWWARYRACTEVGSD